MEERIVRAAVERGNTAYWNDARKSTGATKAEECCMRGSFIDYITRAVVEALNPSDQWTDEEFRRYFESIKGKPYTLLMD